MSTSAVSRSNKFPFTATQWQELEHQALIYKYMVAGIPIPPDLLFSISRNLDSSAASKLFPAYQASPIGWNPYQMGMGMGMGYGGKKIDPEPGRCRRTDGKKWRCSKEAYPDSKYCERHMHRGKNRSRKPVEVQTPTQTQQTPTPKLPSLLNNPSSSSSSSSSFHQPSDTTSSSSFHYGHHLLYDSFKDRGGYGEVGEHPFFTESCGASRGGGSSMQPPWPPRHQPTSLMQAWGKDLGEPPASRKTIHHFFDEWPPKASPDYDSNSNSNSTTQLSISMPTPSHDFFLSSSAPHAHDG